MYEKAAAIYVAGKNFAMAERLVPHINTPKLHLALGKAKVLVLSSVGLGGFGGTPHLRSLPSDWTRT